MTRLAELTDVWIGSTAPIDTTRYKYWIDTSSLLINAPTGQSVLGGDTTLELHPGTSIGADSYNMYITNDGSAPSKTNGTKYTGVIDGQVLTGLVNGVLLKVVFTAVSTEGESSESTVVSSTPLAFYVTTGAVVNFPNFTITQQTDAAPVIASEWVDVTPWDAVTTNTYTFRYKHTNFGNNSSRPLSLMQLTEYNDAPVTTSYIQEEIFLQNAGSGNGSTIIYGRPTNGATDGPSLITLAGPTVLVLNTDYDVVLDVTATTLQMRVIKVSDSSLVMNSGVRTIGTNIYALQAGKSFFVSGMFTSNAAGTGVIVGSNYTKV